MTIRLTPARSCGPIHALATCALLAILMSASGCGVGRVGVTTPSGRTPGVAVLPGVVTRSASAQVASWSRAAASASCQPGEVLIGGGYASSDTFEYAAIIVASYPASATTWTVAATASPAFMLGAEAYCVSTSLRLGLTIAHAPINPAGEVACPAGSVLLSGGFQSDGPVVTSRPDGNGWYAAAPGHSAGTVYALCASQHVRVASQVSASLDPHSASRGQQPDRATLPCPVGQTATAGGFSGGGLVITSASAGAPYAGWKVMAGGDGDLTLYAHCVTFTD